MTAWQDIDAQIALIDQEILDLKAERKRLLSARRRRPGWPQAQKEGLQARAALAAAILALSDRWEPFSPGWYDEQLGTRRERYTAFFSEWLPTQAIKVGMSEDKARRLVGLWCKRGEIPFYLEWLSTGHTSY